MQPGFFCLFDEQACLVCANRISRCSKIAGLKMFLLSCKVQHLGGPGGGCPTLKPSSILQTPRARFPPPASRLDDLSNLLV